MPGLSVLIPVYNRPVAELINALLAQVPQWPGPVEIYLLDDGSEEICRQLNCPLGALPGVRYQELPANVGRAAVRNRLAAGAQYEWLLLLDNTGQLPDGQFLARYAAALDTAPVLAGGVCYAPGPPADAALRLRWRYGNAREVRPAAQRQAAPYGQLLINNLLIGKELLLRFPLDETLRGYGHEDTQLGWQLAAAAVPVRHLENPVCHAGLETAVAFLDKSEQAVRNLAQLLREDRVAHSARLVQIAQRLRRAGLVRAARAALGAAAPALRRHLLGPRPHLAALDALKLLWLLRALHA
ncbi:glycosyltransferase family 2 protein [Hymenobacter nivis]|uniref:Glycosyltransferase family 2 protein n=1 Tax=Hymenobacter nivis TaxID=1850093 RepID=A0A502GQD4_9BACT|nr:glycosyltransferase family 2 protein [Hymenobacter nivis]TPG63732.1 glycosyltransferase family 2 protein [Hymenobacter nivis]